HLHEPDRIESRADVVARACREVGKPILFAVLIIIAVFMPLFTLQGVAGKMFRPLACAVALAMFGSLVYALFQAPMLSNLLMRRTRRKRGQADNKKPSEPMVLRLLLKPYRPLVHFFVYRRWAAVALAVALLSLGAAIVPRLGSEFVPQLNEGDLIVNISYAPSISLAKSKQLTLIAEHRMLEVPGVKAVV